MFAHTQSSSSEDFVGPMAGQQGRVLYSPGIRGGFLLLAEYYLCTPDFATRGQSLHLVREEA